MSVLGTSGQASGCLLNVTVKVCQAVTCSRLSMCSLWQVPISLCQKNILLPTGSDLQTFSSITTEPGGDLWFSSFFSGIGFLGYQLGCFDQDFWGRSTIEWLCQFFSFFYLLSAQLTELNLLLFWFCSAFLVPNPLLSSEAALTLSFMPPFISFSSSESTDT